MSHNDQHDPDDRCEQCRDWPAWWADLAIRMTRTEHRLDELGEQMSNIDDNQTHLDSDVQALTSGLTDIESEIAALKAQPVGQPLNFTALDAAVARVKGDAPVAAAAPVPPVVTTPDPATPPVVTDPAPAPVVDPTPAPVTDPGASPAA